MLDLKTQITQKILKNWTFKNENKKLYDFILFNHEIKKSNIKLEIKKVDNKIKSIEKKLKKEPTNEDNIEKLKKLKNEEYELKNTKDFDRYYNSLSHLLLNNWVNTKWYYIWKRDTTYWNHIKSFLTLKQTEKFLNDLVKTSLVAKNEKWLYLINKELYYDEIIKNKEINALISIISNFVITSLYINSFTYWDVNTPTFFNAMKTWTHKRIINTTMALLNLENAFVEEKNVLRDYTNISNSSFELTYTTESLKQYKSALHWLSDKDRMEKLAEWEISPVYWKYNYTNFSNVLYKVLCSWYSVTEEVREIYTYWKKQKMIKEHFVKESKILKEINQCNTELKWDKDKWNFLAKDEKAYLKKRLKELNLLKSKNNEEYRDYRIWMFVMKNNNLKYIYLVKLFCSLWILKYNKWNFFEVEQDIIDIFYMKWKNYSVSRLVEEIIWWLREIKNKHTPWIQLWEKKACLLWTYYKDISWIKITNDLWFSKKDTELEEYLKIVKLNWFEILEKKSNVDKKTYVIIVNKWIKLKPIEINEIMNWTFNKEVENVKTEWSFNKEANEYINIIRNNIQNTDKKVISKKEEIVPETKTIVEKWFKFIKSINSIKVEEWKRISYWYLTDKWIIYNTKKDVIAKVYSENKLKKKLYHYKTKEWRHLIVLLNNKMADKELDTISENFLNNWKYNSEYYPYFDPKLIVSKESEVKLNLIKDYFLEWNLIISHQQKNWDETIYLKEYWTPIIKELEWTKYWKLLSSEWTRNFVHVNDFFIDDEENESARYTIFYWILVDTSDELNKLAMKIKEYVPKLNLTK